MRRRYLLKLAAVAPLAALVPTVLLESRTDAALAAALPHGDSARAIGQRYLAAFPAEADAARLRSSLFTDVAPGDAATMRRHLKSRVQRDFTDGETVELDGWILARSECRACALLSLLA